MSDHSPANHSSGSIDGQITDNNAFQAWLVDFFAGTVGGVSGVVSGQPFDTIRVRMQAQAYQSSLECVKRTVGNEGVTALYKGLVPPAVGAGAVNAVLFSSYTKILNWQLERRSGRNELYRQTPTSWEVAFSGFGAGLVQALITTPVEGTKILLQGQRRANFHGSLDVARKLYRVNGIGGLYRGFAITIFRDVPSYGVYFSSYDYLKQHRWLSPSVIFGNNRDVKVANAFAAFMAGSISGMLAWLVTYPLDVLKSRLQMDKLKNPKYKGIWHCARKSYQVSGWNVFIRGLGVTMVRAFVVNGPTFMGYELSLKFLKNFMDR